MFRNLFQTLGSFLVAALIFSSQAHAGTLPVVNARCRNPGGLQYQVIYHNDRVTWGSKVLLRYAYNLSGYDESGRPYSYDWTDPQVVETNSAAPYTWTATVGGIKMGPLQFVFEIKNNGASSWDNGSGTTYGRYQVVLGGASNPLQCGPNPPFKQVPVQVAR